MSEAKWPQLEQNQAYKQLVRYLRLLYANQNNRRFAWGITMHGAVFVVALSYCDESQLGFDSTIKWCPTSELWIIECSGYNSHNGAVVKYYARDLVFVAECTFGRHMRGFEASLDPSAVDKPDTFAKDAWPYTSWVLTDKSYDELQIIHNIEALLKTYTVNISGCVMALQSAIFRFAIAGSSDMAGDCTDVVIGPVLVEADAAILTKKAVAEADGDITNEAYNTDESKEVEKSFMLVKCLSFYNIYLNVGQFIKHNFESNVYY
ncbi:hypothetical protein IWW36_000844 [Coemansia brasiliensis]|uniref:Uncharacterized protein n=1 Tax=Coemansia brasiliensis TaxID=2650707 RepID=A0A9W8IA67_9FUNG|nr:hypothetical protein IWW36_000844 [Coemansia brasiliensis]